MNWYALVKRYFDAGLYTGEQVQVFVTAKKITTEQAKEITDSAI
ncbi:putative XkdX family phage protein [Paenibacillus sp. PastF-3]|nr:XkdX family protein [Paenibacillus sp. PastF-3]MDH6371743.1 putative XkdX family phage protein [Paenibacillus sp. PastF-3]